MTDRVGIVVVAHGQGASAVIEAARGVLGSDALDDVVGIDAGLGETSDLSRLICRSVEQVDVGKGVVLLVDVMGASPGECAKRESRGHAMVVVSGVNLAMLLKLASIDRAQTGPRALAAALADSGRRSIAVDDKEIR